MVAVMMLLPLLVPPLTRTQMTCLPLLQMLPLLLCLHKTAQAYLQIQLFILIQTQKMVADLCQ